MGVRPVEAREWARFDSWMRHVGVLPAGAPLTGTAVPVVKSTLTAGLLH